MSSNLVLFIAAMAAGEARAELFCISPETLLDAAGGCQGNALFTRASQACLEKLNAIETDLGGKIEAEARRARAGQKDDAIAARQGYTTTIQAMTRLQDTADQGEKELAIYEPFLALPGLEQAPLLARDGSLNAIEALRAPCYAEGLQGVRGTRREFAAKSARYAARIQEARVAAKSLGVSLEHLEATGSLVAPARSRASGSAVPVPAGNSPRNNSQITGKIRAPKLP